MIDISLYVSNPFRKEEFSSLYNKSAAITTNKTVEIQVISDTATFLLLAFSFRPDGRDHAGLQIELGMFGYEIHFSVLDNRHWDFEMGKWE